MRPHSGVEKREATRNKQKVKRDREAERERNVGREKQKRTP